MKNRTSVLILVVIVVCVGVMFSGCAARDSWNRGVSKFNNSLYGEGTDLRYPPKEPVTEPVVYTNNPCSSKRVEYNIALRNLEIARKDAGNASDAKGIVNLLVAFTPMRTFRQVKAARNLKVMTGVGRVAAGSGLRDAESRVRITAAALNYCLGY